MPVTLNTIAAATGHSRATVSRALGGSSGPVSPETRGHILKVAKELNYMPSAAARGLRGSRTGTIGFYWNHGMSVEAPHALAMLHGALRGLATCGINLMVAAKPPEGGEVPGVVSQRIVDGVIIALDGDQPLADRLRQAGVPYVLAHAQESDNCDTVAVDDDGAIIQVVEYLVELGHRKIAYVNNIIVEETASNWNHASVGYRAKGYAHAVVEFGLQGCSGYEKIQPVHDRLSQLYDGGEFPSALICYDDEIAIRATAWLKDHGLRVPQDVSIVGFNDSEHARAASSPLTSMQLPIAEVGNKAADLLLTRIEDPNLDIRSVKLPMEMVPRESTAPLSKA